MRLGRLPGEAAAGHDRAEGLRRRGRLRAPPPPLRGEQQVPGAARGGRARVLGHVARRPPGRVRRAARPPVLRRHPGAPRVQEPARPPAPAVRGVRAGGRATGPTAAGRASRSRSTSPPAPRGDRSASASSARRRCVDAGFLSTSRACTSPRATARSSTVTSCTTPARSWSCRCRRRRSTRRVPRAPVARRHRAGAARGPGGQARRRGRGARDTANRELEEEIGYVAGRLVKLCEFYNSPGFCDEYTHLFLATELEERDARRGEPRGGGDDHRARPARRRRRAHRDAASWSTPRASSGSSSPARCLAGR